ncbi:MAG: hypothetical protein K6T51_01370 [Rubrobacteraceae bacterium]|nr:hypothetical protein [Rubrobacteraceae bacterium]
MGEIESRPKPDGALPVFRGESWEEHVSAWLEVEESMQNHLWALAAIAASVTTRYGEKAIPKFASEVGYSTRRIYELASTYRAWQYRERSQGLSFQHHAVAARAEDPEAAIERAEVEGLSTRELAAEVRREKEEGAEVVEMMPCPTCGGTGEVPKE